MSDDKCCVIIRCCNGCIGTTLGQSDEEKEERTRMTCVVGLRIILHVTIVKMLLSGFHVLNHDAMFIDYISTDHFIEESVNGVQTMYNG